jgi:hypothetical protein
VIAEANPKQIVRKKTKSPQKHRRRKRAAGRGEELEQTESSITPMKENRKADVKSGNDW